MFFLLNTEALWLWVVLLLNLQLSDSFFPVSSCSDNFSGAELGTSLGTEGSQTRTLNYCLSGSKSGGLWTTLLPFLVHGVVATVTSCPPFLQRPREQSVSRQPWAVITTAVAAALNTSPWSGSLIQRWNFISATRTTVAVGPQPLVGKLFQSWPLSTHLQWLWETSLQLAVDILEPPSIW
jgi:hypothetical protein